MKQSVFRNLLYFASLALLTCLTAAPAMASVTLFADNFDNVAVGAAPSAQIGSWAIAENVVNDTVSGAPSGAQYLESTRPSSGTNVDDHWGQSIAVANAGTALHAEFYINSDTATDFLPQLGLWGAGGTAGAWPASYGALISLFDDNRVTNYDGTAHVDTSLTWTPETWEKYEIDYVVGASSYDLTVGGASTTVSGVLTPGAVQGVYFTQGHDPGTYRIDSALLTASPGPSGIMSIGNVSPADPTTWNSGGNVHVGSSSYGEVAITSGAQVAYDKYFVAGAGSSADGKIVVSGAGSRLEDLTKTTAADQRFIIGDNGTGRLEVLDGAVVNTSYIDYIGLNAGSSGTVVVDGAGSVYESPHSINVGNRDGSTGSLIVQNGGTVEAKSWFDIADATGSNGTVTVKGTGSKLLSPLVWMSYGGNGNAILNIEDGGEVNIGGFFNSWGNGNMSTVNFDNGTMNCDTWCGPLNTVSGDVDTVNGTGTINTHSLVADRMALNFSSAADLNQTFTGIGNDGGVTLNLDFVSSSAEIMGAGVYGKGSMTVSNGVSLDLNGTGIYGVSVIYLARQAGSDGSLTVTGTGSTLEADVIYIGRNGEGIAKINDGGLLIATDTLGTSTNGGSGSIDVSDGGMIALSGDLSADIGTFLAAVDGDANIRWWNTANGSWEALTTAAAGADYTLAYQTSGDLSGYTLLTVTPAGPDGGDANCDGAVDVSDLGILATNYGDASGLGWDDADFNADGAVDVSDLGVLATNYGNGTTAAAVPEPGTMGLLLMALASLALVRFGRRPVS